MSDPRYEKVNPEVGLFRAALAADLSGLTTSGSFGPKGVGLDTNGNVVIGAGANSGVVGLLVKNLPQYPRLGNIPGQTNLAVPMGGKAGNIVDVMLEGEIWLPTGFLIDGTNVAVAGQKYYVATGTGIVSTTNTGIPIGWTVTANRLIVRAGAAVS